MNNSPTAVVTSKPGQMFQQVICAGTHKVVSDVSVVLGGADEGPTPHELFIGALGACTAMTLQMVAQRRKWDLKKLTITLFEEPVDDPVHAGQKIVKITEQIEIEANLSQAELNILEAAAKKCPVYKLLVGPKQVETVLVQKGAPPVVPSAPQVAAASESTPLSKPSVDPATDNKSG